MPTTEPRDEQGRIRLALVLLVVLALAGGAFYLSRSGLVPLLDPERCEAEVGDLTVGISQEQAENAAIIASEGVRRGLPARAVSIALATAYQESKLLNLDYGDRDSLGLFQQRPSQGWGTPEQVQDPRHATNAFYDALVKIDGYRDMRITEAAQAVQRSGFPEAYEDHAADGRALASALTGYSPARFTCAVDRADLGRQQLDEGGLTGRARRVLDDVSTAFGPLSVGGFAPGGVDSGHVEGSAHYEGAAVDLFVRPVTNASNRKGWALAHYLVAHAERLHVNLVIFDKRIWSSRRSQEGWRTYRSPARDGDQDVLDHRDHVHVEVVNGS